MQKKRSASGVVRKVLGLGKNQKISYGKAKSQNLITRKYSRWLEKYIAEDFSAEYDYIGPVFVYKIGPRIFSCQGWFLQNCLSKFTKITVFEIKKIRVVY